MNWFVLTAYLYNLHHFLVAQNGGPKEIEGIQVHFVIHKFLLSLCEDC